MLGATPDSILIIENGELVPVEIKCPWRWAHNLEVKYVEGKQFVRKGDGHHYYFQLQLQILLCKVKLNILVIFALYPDDFHVLHTIYIFGTPSNYTIGEKY